MLIGYLFIPNVLQICSAFNCVLSSNLCLSMITTLVVFSGKCTFQPNQMLTKKVTYCFWFGTLSLFFWGGGGGAGGCFCFANTIFQNESLLCIFYVVPLSEQKLKKKKKKSFILNSSSFQKWSISFRFFVFTD